MALWNERKLPKRLYEGVDGGSLRRTQHAWGRLGAAGDGSNGISACKFDGNISSCTASQAAPAAPTNSDAKTPAHVASSFDQSHPWMASMYLCGDWKQCQMRSCSGSGRVLVAWPVLCTNASCRYAGSSGNLALGMAAAQNRPQRTAVISQTDRSQCVFTAACSRSGLTLPL